MEIKVFCYIICIFWSEAHLLNCFSYNIFLSKSFDIDSEIRNLTLVSLCVCFGLIFICSNIQIILRTFYIATMINNFVFGFFSCLIFKVNFLCYLTCFLSCFNALYGLSFSQSSSYIVHEVDNLLSVLKLL